MPATTASTTRLATRAGVSPAGATVVSRQTIPATVGATTLSTTPTNFRTGVHCTEAHSGTPPATRIGPPHGAGPGTSVPYARSPRVHGEEGASNACAAQRVPTEQPTDATAGGRVS
ncbi:hypothetical protein [Streptomyces sp. CB09001]|uniref:hypothetical protein n=1 Tax=Streptomyces sp. CB09001 TaxID=2083284 RepID=UPI0013BE908D|nr:hypothetical protein [Streptomyces sp. CB09001]